ncbi:hypothetical protein LJK88_19230 [Paenibacillus sp. P26]|nr:hypothetical protein LJK88_19230 [Paenibacillus sp. P26]UUZ96172.1 hypothetical protein LJK87_18595 [Paenibacillus sp. P25]
MNDKQGKTVYTSKFKFTDKDQIVLLSWNEEDQLTYEVHASDQTVKTYLIKMKDLSESGL